MSKLTVKEYATLNNVTVQSVYKKLSNGSLEYREINNVKYIIIEDEIDYEKKFNDLQVKYDSLLEILKMKDELLDELKDKQRLFNMLLPAPEKKEKKNKKKKSKKDK